MTTALEILECGRCGAPVALVDASSVPCQHCGARVEIPETHAEALRTATQGQAARARAGDRVEALGEKPQAAFLWLACLLIVVLPSMAVFLLSKNVALSFSRLELDVYAGLPASLPGVGLLLWTAAANGTSARFCDALSAAPAATAKGSMRCRACAAPLSSPETGHVVRCAYCGCDNLLRVVDLDVLQRDLSGSLRTLDQAIRMMRVRRALWGLGIFLMMTVMMGLVALVPFAQR